MIKNLSVVVLLSFACCFAFGQAMNQTEEGASTPITKINFQESVFEFGEIQEGEKIKNVFVFTNTGTEPLVISNAKGSCGCTVPMWPKEPILPGESADILVQFDSKGKGKIGGNLQSKRVTLTANTEPKNTYLTIKGKVFRPEEDAPTISMVPTQEVKKEIKAAKIDMDVDADKVALYPNPTDGELRLNLSDYANTAGSIEIYNGAGAKVEEREVTDFGDELIFNVTAYIPGIYTVSIKLDGKNRIAKRFVVPENE